MPVPEPARQPSPTIPLPGAGGIADGEVVVAGCLQKGQDGDPDGARFVLTGATLSRPKDESNAGTKAAPAGRTYDLVAGGRSATLADHVGHKVEVTGVVTMPPATADTATLPSNVTLTVSAVKRLAASCSTAG
jgi:hypothetical protein